MTENFDKVIAVIKYLGLRPNLSEYRWRFLLQKITFLAQSLGLNTDYNFTPYVAGPYSTALTSDYNSQTDELISLQTDYELTESDVEHLDIINESLDLNGSLSLLEATSTIVYIMTEESRSVDDDIFVRAKSLKPHLSESFLIIGMTKGKQLLFKEEYLTEELKKEMDVWDKLE